MAKVLELYIVLALAVCSATSFSFRVGQPQIASADQNKDVETSSAVDDSLRDLLEDLRNSLRCGFPDQGIPPLAPFHIKSANVDERGLLYNIRGNVQDFTVSGLDGYTVDVVTLNIITLRFSLGLTFPKISLTSFYDMDALLLRFIPIYGHGRLNFDVNDLTVQANGRITLSFLTGRLNLTTLDIGVGMGSTFSDSTGVYDSRIVSTFFNIGLERMVRTIFDDNKENLETALENLLIPLANQFLNELTLQDLLNLIINRSAASYGRVVAETGELICNVNEESPTTTEYVPSATVPDEVTDQTATSTDQTTTSEPTTTTSDQPTTTSDQPSTTSYQTTDKGIESDDFYDNFDRQLKNTVMTFLRNAI